MKLQHAQAPNQTRRAFLANASKYAAVAPLHLTSATVPAFAVLAPVLQGCGLTGIDAGRRESLPADGARPIQALDFPGSAAVAKTMRFRFDNPLALHPATYIWSCYPRRQAGYYTAFFWGNDDGKEDTRTFLWAPKGAADSYYGAHPYPYPMRVGKDHNWEISVLQHDFVNGAVDYDRWHLQAFRVWRDASGMYHEYFWDLPYTDRPRRVTYKTPRWWGNVMPPVPTLTWGDAPWAPGKEVWNGMLRGIQVYESCLSVGDILRETQQPRSTAQGARSLWYLNLDPTPDDIADRSGRGHDPVWVGPERPGVWRGQQHEVALHARHARVLQPRPTISDLAIDKHKR